MSTNATTTAPGNLRPERKIVSPEEWLAARKQFLIQEKEFTRLRDQLSRECYSRGIDILNVAYNYLDLVPKGRDEADLDFSMSWLDYHDKY